MAIPSTSTVWRSAGNGWFRSGGPRAGLGRRRTVEPAARSGVGVSATSRRGRLRALPGNFGSSSAPWTVAMTVAAERRLSADRWNRPAWRRPSASASGRSPRKGFSVCRLISAHAMPPPSEDAEKQRREQPAEPPRLDGCGPLFIGKTIRGERHRVSLWRRG